MDLLDATVFIDYLRAVPEAVNFIGSVNPKNTAISVVTLAEVLVGCSHQEEEQVLHFTESFHFFDVNKDIAVSAARLRQEYRWKLPDAFQAALSLKYHLIFITRNTKDFNPAVHKFVKIPYKLRG